MSSKQAALDLARPQSNIRYDGEAPGEVHLRVARVHRPASQERLVDQPIEERRREAPMDRPIRHHRNGVSLIARKLAIEIADRHTQSIERHGLTPDDLLYGLKPTTRLDAP